MSKYIVIKLLNSGLDSCSIRAKTNPSGVCVCSTGDGTPWSSVESGIFDSKQEAIEYSRTLFGQLLLAFRTEGTYDGWEITHNGEGCIQALHIDEDTNTGEVIWVVKVEVLEIPSENALDNQKLD